MLNLAKTLSSSCAAVCDQVLKYSTPYLPENLEKPFASAVQYAQDVNTAVAQVRCLFQRIQFLLLFLGFTLYRFVYSLLQAESLGDLKDEAIKEAKEGYNYVHGGFVDVLDRVAVYPPVSWLVRSLPMTK